MPNQNTRNRLSVSRAEMVAAYLDGLGDELLDAAIAAAALVARADGAVEPAERAQLWAFLGRKDVLPAVTEAELLDAFDHRIRSLDAQHGVAAAVDSLGRLAGRPSARLIVELGEHVAAADGHLHAREVEILRLIRLTLAAPAPTIAPRNP
jgi:tellurite resistance protein